MRDSDALRRHERTVPHWDETCDVLIVGFGCAGACAAIEAAHSDTNADVLVVERSGGPGGTSANSGSFIYLGGGTALQRALEFEDDVENMYDYMMAACGPGPDPALIQPYCEGSVAHFDWLVAQGIPFKSSFFDGAHEPFETDDGLVYTGGEHAHPFRDIARPVPRGHLPQGFRDRGAILMKHLIESAHRAGVRTQTQARCDALVTADDDSIVGAIVSTLEGEKAIRAKRGVILTAGGFIFNKAMLKRYAPTLARCKYKVGTETDDGLGIRLGLAAGGEAIRMDAGDVTMALFPPNDLRRGILVNAQGQRFMNEDVYMGRAGEFVMYRQQGEAYLIVDDDCFARPVSLPVQIAGVGESIQELESEIGFPAGSLSATVDYYNQHAGQGQDPLFHKGRDFVTPLDSPPYGALDLRAENYAYAALTLGGLWITPDGQVRTSTGEAVPGLYAAGRTTSGVAKHGYSSGMSIGDCSFFGRQAGRHAAARTPSG